ncbi:MAG: energy-coupling factor transporter ATPase [candidate division Zixibacteria bacterium]|nr:energy-coupling factor transporter ATPase [candidate division Zixibacteria bacterium]
MIRLRNVTFRYDSAGAPALRDLSLEIRAGESVCIMGANGCGKSTLARILAGLLKVSQGEFVLTGVTDRPIPVGILFQNPDNQMVAVTVEKEIAFALENLAVPFEEMDARVGATLKRFGIEHLRTRLTSELSGGEKQRVALASVMICKPPVLVLDEPDSFLDARGRVALREEEEQIRHENADMILVRITQYPSVAKRYQRLIVLDRGRVAADGPPQEILADRSFRHKTGLCYQSDGVPVELPQPLRRLSGRNSLVHRLAADAVSFAYADGRTVLKNLTITLNGGETVGLVGATGSGKSTFGHLLCGLLRPSGGSLDYYDADGKEVDIALIRGQISGVFQQPERQFFLPTCAEEIAFGPRNLGLSITTEEVTALFDLVGLDAKVFAERDPFTLSMGEKRRLAFAAVLSMSPQFIVFDEPTCGLDPAGVGRFIKMARTLRQLGVGLVVISHDGTLINAVADKVLHFRGVGEYHHCSCREFFESDENASILTPVDGQYAG